MSEIYNITSLLIKKCVGMAKVGICLRDRVWFGSYIYSTVLRNTFFIVILFLGKSKKVKEDMFVYLSDALKREAINSPAIPGRLSNISNTIKGIIYKRSNDISYIVSE